MAYQNVGIPRFYIDYLQYWNSLGLLYMLGSTTSHTYPANPTGNHPKWIGLNPTSTDSFTSTSSGNYRNWLRCEAIIQDSLVIPSKMWSGIFGHNLKSANKGFSTTENDSVSNHTSSDVIAIVNDAGSSSANDGDVPYDGFTMRTFTPGINLISAVHFRIEGVVGEGGEEVTIGSLGYGGYYDMPHSPDLNLTMSIEMDGVKNIKTKGGVSLTGINYTKPQDWGDMGAWQLGGVSNLRNGRRVWDLSFSYLADSDIMPFLGIQNYNYYAIEYDYEDILSGTDFFSQVINKTMGGHLPFIFQPDKDNANPDQFAICRFDMKSFEYEQVANNIYNIKLKIREVW